MGLWTIDDLGAHSRRIYQLCDAQIPDWRGKRIVVIRTRRGHIYEYERYGAVIGDELSNDETYWVKV